MEKEKDPVRAFLESYWDLRKEVTRMEHKIKDLEALCYRATSQITGMPGGGGSGGAKRVWDALADIRSNALTALKYALERSQEIEDFVARVEDPRYRKLLQYHYIDGLTFADTAGHMNYNLRHIRRLHGEALDAARELWRNLGR